MPQDHIHRYPHTPEEVWMTKDQAKAMGLPVSEEKVIAQIRANYPKVVASLDSPFTIMDLAFVGDLLPDYEIRVNKKMNGLVCFSKTGISDEDHDYEWNRVFRAIKTHFGERFSEVFHTTCTNHMHFTIYIKKDGKG